MKAGDDIEWVKKAVDYCGGTDWADEIHTEAVAALDRLQGRLASLGDVAAAAQSVYDETELVHGSMRELERALAALESRP